MVAAEAGQGEEAMRLWVDRQGWMVAPGIGVPGIGVPDSGAPGIGVPGIGAPGMDTGIDSATPAVQGSWATADPVEAWPALVTHWIEAGPLTLILSPEWFLYLCEPLEGEKPPAELARRSLGLSLGAWQLQTRIQAETYHIAALKPEMAMVLEKLTATWPEKLSIALAPLSGAPGREGPELLTFRTRALLWESDDKGETQLWHWLPEPLPEDLPRRTVEAWLRDGSQRSWLFWQGPARQSFMRLLALRRVLVRVVAVTALSAIVAWAAWGTRRPALNEALKTANAYLAAHREEAQRIEVIQASGEVAWERLHEIQTFSNRSTPLANRLAALANVAGEEMAWLSCHWEEGHFTLTLAGKKMTEMLDAVDRIRQLPELAWLRAETVENKVRARRMEVKVEGGFR